MEPFVLCLLTKPGHFLFNADSKLDYKLNDFDYFFMFCYLDSTELVLGEAEGKCFRKLTK